MKREILINSSSFRYAVCPRAYKYFVVDELQPITESKTYKMAYGTAVHMMLQSYYGNGASFDYRKAIDEATLYYSPYTKQLGDKDWHTSYHLQRTMYEYLRHYKTGDLITPIRVNDKPLVEQRLKYKFYEDDDLIVSFYGTVDLIADYAGTTCIVDHKVTSSPRIDDFLSKYEFSLQPMFYSHLLHKLTNTEYLPVLINGIFIKAGTHKAEFKDTVSFKRSQIITFAQEQLQEFETFLASFVSQLVQTIRKQETPLPNYAACNAGFTPCGYLQLCKSELNYRDIIRLSKFTRRDVNPFKYAE